MPWFEHDIELEALGRAHECDEVRELDGLLPHFIWSFNKAERLSRRPAD